MRIAIVHYHLRPGGVTRVIQNALSALNARGVCSLIFAGEPPSAAMPVPNYAVVDSLGYHQPDRTYPSPEAIVKELETTAIHTLGGLPDVWHIHNHALGKNLILPQVVAHLAHKGHRLLLQFHDFAEDGRPENYRFLVDGLCPHQAKTLGARLYPQRTHIHYALINQRDLSFLTHSGAAASRLHYLPNAVSMEVAREPAPSQGQQTAHRVFFYPVRGIRRKNIGEFLLWSTRAQENESFAIARAPQNPAARPIYDDWVAFAQAQRLPVTFSVGEQWQGEFSALLESAYALVTTSVAEGFGLAFLEPWLIPRPLVGRNLPEITAALTQSGVDLSCLYRRIEIPLEWVGKQRFRQEVAASLHAVYEAYNRKVSAETIEAAIAEAVQTNRVDFGRLNEPLQKVVIERLNHSPSLWSAVSPSDLMPAPTQDATLRSNREAVLEHFNLDAYGERLMHIYRTVAASVPESLDELDADKLLDQFLAPQRFYLLRT
ncbi:hypothetical protein GF339_03640 [candidate division KSB3 bacterium]|uniref:Glycosyltransferase subfamily 4-like N-terminal domain-containing protein n=1 Tax=candidate division KSB3 bacterium TaxID=2044937 RepID=A0A9D5JT66_9BACT|nr:hypothetical protein [candidate division KSB3 bacterium]MBD3323650.1 hypothetical protein [candidate division KSB3 bacterium]